MAGLTLRELTASFPRAGRLQAIHLRPARHAATVRVTEALLPNVAASRRCC